MSNTEAQADTQQVHPPGLLAGRFDPGALGDMPGLYLQIVLLAVGAGLLLLLLAGRIGRLTGNKDR